MQFDFPVIDPQVTTGTDLANYLNSWQAALESCHKGPARPVYAQPGTLWIQDPGVGAWSLKVYTGTLDAQIGTIDPVTGTFSILVGGIPPANVEDAIAYAVALG